MLAHHQTVALRKTQSPIHTLTYKKINSKHPTEREYYCRNNHEQDGYVYGREDDCLTEHLDKAAKIMNIRLIDHVILTDGKYYSYADEGRI